VTRLALLLMALAIAGCQQMAEVPTLQYCDHVIYERTEHRMHIEADCDMPYGRI